VDVDVHGLILLSVSSVRMVSCMGSQPPIPAELWEQIAPAA